MISDKFKVITLDATTHQLRGLTPEVLVNRWFELVNDDSRLAMRWLLMLRDPRGGLGERRAFRVISTVLVNSDVLFGLKFARNVDLPTLGRWDDLVYLYSEARNTAVQSVCVERVAAQLDEDLRLVADGRRPSLMAKWLPSINASSATTRRVAARLARDLHCSPRSYRKTLSELRAELNLAEVALSAGRGLPEGCSAGSLRKHRAPARAAKFEVTQWPRENLLAGNVLEAKLLSRKYVAADQFVDLLIFLKKLFAKR